MTDKNLSDLITSSYTGGNLIDDTANTTGNIWTAVKISNEIDESANTSFSNAVSEAVDLANAAFTNAVAEAISLSDDAFTNAVSAATSLADDAFTNAVAEAISLSDDAFTNAVAEAISLSDDAFTNAVSEAISLANAAFTNAVAEAISLSNDAFTNAVSEAIDLANAAFSNAVSYADGLLAANDAMVFKGTLGSAGTFTSLPTTHDVGWTIKVIQAGTYAGQVAEIGDMYVSLVSREGTNNQDTDWAVIQANIDGAVTGPVSAANNSVAIFSGTTGKVIADGGQTLPSGTIVGTTDTQTLENKTLTSPVINTPTGLVKGDVGLGNVSNDAQLKIDSNLSDLANVATARTNLGLGSIATQNANTIAVTGGSINGTSIGGTTANTGAFTNLAYTGTLTGGTGVVNLGSGQVVKDAAGNVGIGTTSPSYVLDVHKASDDALMTIQAATNNFAAGIRIRAQNANGSRFNFINSGALDGTSDWAIGRVSNNVNNQFGIWTAGTERMRITSAGRVGIGTTSPSQMVHTAGNIRRHEFLGGGIFAQGTSNAGITAERDGLWLAASARGSWSRAGISNNVQFVFFRNGSNDNFIVWDFILNQVNSVTALITVGNFADGVTRGFIYQYSLDGGSNWITLESWSFGIGNVTKSNTISLAASSASGIRYIKFRAGYTSGAANNNFVGILRFNVTADGGTVQFANSLG